ncbi:MAG: hypothetical protein QXG46_00755 [Ignisphaera sp.]
MLNRYLYIDKNTLVKKLTPRATYTWIPVQIIRFRECRPKELYIVDCFFRSRVDDPYISLILLRKLPKKIRIVDQAPLDVKKIVCECKDVIIDLTSIVRDIIMKDYSKLYSMLDFISEYRDIEIATRFFLRTKKYVIKAEQIKKMDRKLAVRVTESLMDRVCLYDKKENKELYTPIDIEYAYALMYIDPVIGTSGLAVENKLIEIKTYTKLVKKLSLENQFSLEPLTPSSDMHH